MVKIKCFYDYHVPFLPHMRQKSLVAHFSDSSLLLIYYVLMLNSQPKPSISIRFNIFMFPCIMFCKRFYTCRPRCCVYVGFIHCWPDMFEIIYIVVMIKICMFKLKF